MRVATMRRNQTSSPGKGVSFAETPDEGEFGSFIEISRVSPIGTLVALIPVQQRSTRAHSATKSMAEKCS